MKQDSLKTEGDINLSAERTKWQEQNIVDRKTQQLLADDARLFFAPIHVDALPGCIGWLCRPVH